MRTANSRQGPKRITAGTIAVMLAASAAAACGGSPAGSASAGTLDVGTAAEPSSLDPAAGTAGTDYPILYSLYARLIDFAPKTLKPEPGIATSWRFSGANKQTFTLHLKSGLKFQDGTPVNAQAVKASLEHFKDMKTLTDLDSVRSITTKGAQTVVLHLSEPMSILPAILADRAGMIVSPTALKKWGRNFGAHPVGAGPYAFTSYTPGQTVTLKKSPNYMPAGDPAPKLAGITFHIISNSTALTNALTSGTVQYAYQVDATNLPRLRSSKGLVTRLEPSLSFAELFPNINYPPLNKKQVRQAISYGLDRQAMADSVMGKGTTKAAWSMLPPGNPFYDPSTTNAWPYDPQKARQLLAEAGYPHGITIKGISAAPGGPFEQDSVIAAAQLQKVGIHINWTQEQGPQAIADFSDHRKAPIFSIGWSGRPDPYMTYWNEMSKESYYQAGHLDVPGVEATLRKIRRTYDPDARKSLLHKLNVIEQDQVLIIPLYFQPNVTVYADSVHGDTPNLLGKTNLNTLSIDQ